MRVAALLVLSATGLYLVALGLVALARPVAAMRFFSGFAQSSRANTAEGLLRLLVGLAFLYLAGDLGWPLAAGAVGLVLAGSALWMLAMPAMHRRVANRAVPAAAGLMPLVGLVAVAAGAALGAILLPLF